MDKTEDNKKRNEVILETVNDFFENLNIEAEDMFVEDMEADEENEEQVLAGIKVANPASVIGFRGRTLASLQLLVSLAVKNKLNRFVRVLLDINDYRKEQKTRLEQMALKAVERVKAGEERVALPPMSSYERRICHLVVQDLEGISSESEGEGEDRRIVIKLG